MNPEKVIQHLKRNRKVLFELLYEVPEEQIRWKYQPDKWSLIQIICHLYDEEILDFRARVKHILETPKEQMIPFDPIALVESKKYQDQDFYRMLEKFNYERKQSILWLEALENPAWDNTYQHSILGEITAKYMLNNWLAHDYIHIRQITRTLFFFQREVNSNDLNYAGTW